MEVEQKELDRWAEWILHRRFPADPAGHDVYMRHLYTIRDRVLQNAGLEEGSTLLDVGAGDGLIAFGALHLVGEKGQLILSDISGDLLAVAQLFAQQTGVEDRCRFLIAPAQDLSSLQSGAVDSVTTRSVLIYVKEKEQTFREFYRVLRPGGRISLFEPINAFAARHDTTGYWGIDVTPVHDLAARVRAVYDAIHPQDDPMLGFDERDLLELARSAGFSEIHLDYEARIVPTLPGNWQEMLSYSPTPLAPTLQEAINQVLDAQEAQEFEAYMQRVVERGGHPAYRACAYLWAVK